MTRVPWAKNAATLCTRLNPAGGESELIRGRKAILDLVTSILPAVRSLKVLHFYTGDAGWVGGQAEISLSNDKTPRRIEGQTTEIDSGGANLGIGART